MYMISNLPSSQKNTVVSTWLEDETVESHLFDDGSPSGGVFEKEKKCIQDV